MRILLVDDEEKLLRITSTSLRKKGYTVHSASNGNEARKAIADNTVDIVFLDIMLPDISGLSLLEEFKELYPNKIFIMITAYANIQNAVAAMKAGAFNYLVKPVKLDELVIAIEKAREWLELTHENKQLKERLQDIEANHEYGFSPGIKHLLPLIEKVAGTDASILLEGETGTGKSMIASMIHKLSSRNTAPFMTINCAAIPDQLLESEFFGYEKGAFTGAVSNRIGKFEAANKGTVFLDEIGEISTALQAKLLQVTQSKQFMRLGSNAVKEIDVRIITATNKHLKEMVDDGSFREDLYYRLKIVNIEIPPLRQRKDDVPYLVEIFLNHHRKRDGKKYKASKRLLDVLAAYSWPGNVRELENAVERAVVLCQGEDLSIDDFPSEITAKNDYTIDTDKTLPAQLEVIEKQIIAAAIAKTYGNASEAARTLGISRQNLLYKMNKYNIKG